MLRNIKTLLVHQGFEMYGSDKSFLSFIQKQTLFETTTTDIIISREGSLSQELNKLPYRVSYYGMGRLPLHEIRRNPIKYLVVCIRDIFIAVNVVRRYELIYINTIAPLSWLIAAALLNKKRCVHVREIPQAGISLLVSLFLRKNCKVIFNSIVTENSFKSLFNLNSSHVNNGVSALKVQTVGPYIYGDIIKDGFFNVLIPGRINSWKGQDFVLECIIKYGALFEGINWIFAGDVALNQEWRYSKLKEIVDYDSVENIHFLGWRDDLADLMFYSDLIVVPSVKPEPFGRVVIEAMSIGRLVLASNHGGPANIITRGENGFLFDPLNKESFRDELISVKDLGKSDRKIIESAAIKEFKKKYSEKIYLTNLSNELEKHFIKTY